MIKLYGVAVSNYFSSAKAAFLEKNVEFEEITIFPSQDEAVLAQSPMGKVPWIEIGDEILTETNVIYDYLEDISPEPRLYPIDPWQRAKVKEIIRVIELYFDAPARRHIGAVYFGQEVDPSAKEQVRPAIENGLRALNHLALFSPYIAGETFTFADITAYFMLNFTQMHTTKIYGWDMIGDTPALKDYLDFIGDRESLKELTANMQAEFEALASK
jgi:glutathione S-transferase